MNLWNQSEAGSIDCEINPEKRMDFFCFLLFENPSIAHNFGTTGWIQVGFSAKCTSPNEHLIENWKWRMSELQLISLDRITINVST